MNVNWTEVNDLDAKLLARVDLTPLPDLIAGDEELAAAVEQHDADLAELKDRFSQLTEQRRSMADDDAPGDIRRRIHGHHLIMATWDLLASLHELLDVRRDLLRRMQARLAAEVSDLAQRRHERLKAAASGSDDDDPFADLSDQIAAREPALRRLCAMRRRAGIDQRMVMARREEAHSLHHR